MVPFSVQKLLTAENAENAEHAEQAGEYVACPLHFPELRPATKELGVLGELRGERLLGSDL